MYKMEKINRQNHWENIYLNKAANEVSWHQDVPATSIQFIQALQIPTSAKIIDIGGGDSLLIDHLIKMNYTDLSVLDISETAIIKAKKRLGENAEKVNWIISDVNDFKPTEIYDFWHDRATFHFITEENEIANYIQLAYKNISINGKLVLGTFSENGPKKCSGITIKQYS